MVQVGTSDVAYATRRGTGRKLDYFSDGTILGYYHLSGVAGTVGQFITSSDDGQSWTDLDTITNVNGSGTAYEPDADFFIDHDDYLHVVWTDTVDGLLYVHRASWDGSSLSWIGVPYALFGVQARDNSPAIVGYVMEGERSSFVVWSRPDFTNGWSAAYITRVWESGGNLTDYMYDVIHNEESFKDTFPSIDFQHTGDGKTPAVARPHLYVSMDFGTLGTWFARGDYESAGDNHYNWYGAIGALDANRRRDQAWQWAACRFDGTNVIVGGTLLNAGTFGDQPYFWSFPGTGGPADATTYFAGVEWDDYNERHGSFALDPATGDMWLAGRQNWSIVDGTHYRRVSGGVADPRVDIDTTTHQTTYPSVAVHPTGKRLDVLFTSSGNTVHYASNVLNFPPDTPTVSLGATKVSVGDALAVTWPYSDPEGDTQEAYQLRYRPVGGAWVERLEVPSSAGSGNLDTTGLAGQDYEVAVRVKGGGQWSAWSAASAPFTVVTTNVQLLTATGWVDVERTVLTASGWVQHNPEPL